MTTTLWAVADLHAAVKKNHERIDQLVPPNPEDWLIVAGDVAEREELVIRIMRDLARRYAKVIWVPGNHELFSRTSDRFRGREKYESLVRQLRRIGVVTPEDDFPVFDGVTVVPLFTLYDYSFRGPGMTVEQALESAQDKQIVMTDEVAIAPFADIRAWCWDRLTYSVKRLSKIKGPTVLVNHWPLVQEPTLQLRWPEIALWCGTRHTRGWAMRYNAKAVVYGHLHIPSEIEVDGVKHVEVSLGYPKEWTTHPQRYDWPYPVVEAE